MMTCHEVERFIDDYLEHALKLGVRLKFEMHLRLCSECRRYLARYRRAIELGQKLLAEQPERAAAEAVPEDLVNAILLSVDDEC